MLPTLPTILRSLAVIAIIALSLQQADHWLRVTPLTPRRVATVVALVVTLDFCLIWLVIRAAAADPWGAQDTALLGVFAVNGVIVFAGAYTWYQAHRKTPGAGSRKKGR